MNSTEILFARKTLKSSQTWSDKTKTDIRERKRNILYLIHCYLVEHKLCDTAENLMKEAQLSTEYQVCENVDLEIILQEYQSYYFTKFQKYPKIVKKLEESVGSAKGKPKSSARMKQTPQAEEINKSEVCNFPIVIKPLFEQVNDDVHCEDKETSDISDFDTIPADMKNLADQIKKEFISTNIETSWDDCIGLSSVVEKLKEASVYPLLYKDLFKNVTTWKGVLLFGPPGNGKTLLAKAVASEGTTFINVTSSTFISKWRGESEKMLKLLFQLARKFAPTTIFVDEVDALVQQESHHEASKRFKSELLTQIDGVQNCPSNVFVLGSTNSPWNLDPALLRRFEKRILVPLPDETSRQKLLRKYLGHNDIQTNELEQLAKLTENFSACDIKCLCKEVTMSVIREKIDEINKKGSNKVQMDTRTITFKDVIDALERVSSSAMGSNINKYYEWNKKYGSW
ncbi:unnamed protein product [Diabrotica balteata]|uniref:AAA+ ATPase domain-containing protein n=1 Tax=Diabrotica balteata TaxID=107213 RepID=A0A9N9T584_DIABA|nr:unnamed protein product [Diabrotica balteata]